MTRRRHAPRDLWEVCFFMLCLLWSEFFSGLRSGLFFVLWFVWVRRPLVWIRRHPPNHHPNTPLKHTPPAQLPTPLHTSQMTFSGGRAHSWDRQRVHTRVACSRSTSCSQLITPSSPQRYNSRPRFTILTSIATAASAWTSSRTVEPRTYHLQSLTLHRLAAVRPQSW